MKYNLLQFVASALLQINSLPVRVVLARLLDFTPSHPHRCHSHCREFRDELEPSPGGRGQSWSSQTVSVLSTLFSWPPAPWDTAVYTQCPLSRVCLCAHWLKPSVRLETHCIHALMSCAHPNKWKQLHAFVREVLSAPHWSLESGVWSPTVSLKQHHIIDSEAAETRQCSRVERCCFKFDIQQINDYIFTPTARGTAAAAGTKAEIISAWELLVSFSLFLRLSVSIFCLWPQLAEIH